MCIRDSSYPCQNSPQIVSHRIPVVTIRPAFWYSFLKSSSSLAVSVSVSLSFRTSALAMSTVEPASSAISFWDVYKRQVQNWNDGKTQEYKERRMYDVRHSILKRNPEASKKVAEAMETAREQRKACLLYTSSLTLRHMKMMQRPSMKLLSLWQDRKSGRVPRKQLSWTDSRETAVRGSIGQKKLCIWRKHIPAKHGREDIRRRSLDNMKWPHICSNVDLPVY